LISISTTPEPARSLISKNLIVIAIVGIETIANGSI